MDRSDTGDKEHATDDTELTTNHKGGQVVVVAVVGEKKSASGPGEVTVSTFVLLKLSDSKVSNLGTFKETNDEQEESEKDNRGPSGDTFPHGRLSVEKGVKGDVERENDETDRHDGAAIKEDGLRDRTRGLVGFNCLACAPSSKVLDKVGRMKDTREFNSHGDPDSEEGKPVVDCRRKLKRQEGLAR